MKEALQTYEFRGKQEGPHLLITGGVHGDEFEPIAAIRQLIEQFRHGEFGSGGFCGRITFVPIVNESAFLRGHRCADDGLDLARTCPGKADGSVTERTAWHLSNLIRTANFYIDLHTGGTELSVYPLAGYMMHENPDVLDAQRKMARAFNLPVVWGTAANLDGRSLSIARDANIPAIYCEFRGEATCDPLGVDAYVNGCRNVMSQLGMIDPITVASIPQQIIENAAPNSGHMQVCNPSPVNGYFESSVSLGSIIESGDRLGTVYPIDGGAPIEIKAAESGIVLVLRTFPRVKVGDSVGVVVALNN